MTLSVNEYATHVATVSVNLVALREDFAAAAQLAERFFRFALERLGMFRRADAVEPNLVLPAILVYQRDRVTSATPTTKSTAPAGGASTRIVAKAMQRRLSGDSLNCGDAKCVNESKATLARPKNHPKARDAASATIGRLHR